MNLGAWTSLKDWLRVVKFWPLPVYNMTDIVIK